MELQVDSENYIFQTICDFIRNREKLEPLTPKEPENPENKEPENLEQVASLRL